MLKQDDIEPLIVGYAQRFQIPHIMLRAQCVVESGLSPYKWNPEPRYRYLVDAHTGKPFRRLTESEIASELPPTDFPGAPGAGEDRDAEWWGQQASWGLMQIMGAVARELGLHGSLTLLIDPEINLQYGCAHLFHLHMRYYSTHGWRGVLAAYNTGQPQNASGAGAAYVRKIEAAMNRSLQGL